MTRSAGAFVNDALVPSDHPLGIVAGVDFAASVANVRAWGGQAWLYARAVDAGLRAAREPVDRELALGIGAIAGWRSGVLDLADDARRRVQALYDRQQTVVAGSTLGLPPGAVHAFLTLQQRAPLGWPLFAVTDPVARVGGFQGLGGPWLAPPRALARHVDGQLVVRCADAGLWWLEVDVFGSRLSPAPPIPADALRPVTTGVRGQDSYLLTLTGELR